MLFRGKNMKTQVIGCPKTIDGDLKSKEVPISFGFDTACKVILKPLLYIVTQAIKFLPYHTNRTVHSLIYVWCTCYDLHCDKRAAIFRNDW